MTSPPSIPSRRVPRAAAWRWSRPGPQIRRDRQAAGAHAAVAERAPSEQAAFAALDLDAAIVVAYGLLLPKAILDAPRLGCFNLHGSLLPRWRGAAPIQRAVMAGDAETGVMVMQMDEGLDTGPVLMAERVADRPQDLRRTGGEAVAAGRRPDGAGAGRAGTRRDRGAAASRQTASPMPRKSPRTKRASTGRKAPPRSIA